jgi:hypothetical protein
MYWNELKKLIRTIAEFWYHDSAVRYVDHNDHVYGVRLRLTFGHQRAYCSSPSWIWAWITMMEWYWQGKTLDTSTRALWQFNQQSYLVIKKKELAKEMMNSALRSIFVYTSEGFLTCYKILRHGANGFTSLPKEGMLWNFIALKTPSLLARFEPANLGSKHANNYTTEED